jgi:D-amino peptidase
MAGTADGTLNHTQSSRTIESYTLNGREIGEIAQFALYHGALGIPLILLTGDEAACREAAALVPGITTVGVKTGLSRQAAISVSRTRSHELIREGVREALEMHRTSPMVPLVWDGPFVLEKRYFHTESADRYESDPRYERVDARTVRIASNSILDVIYA